VVVAVLWLYYGYVVVVAVVMGVVLWLCCYVAYISKKKPAYNCLTMPYYALLSQ